MATPTLALIPTGYKAGKLYSVLPESGVGDFTVVRATEATRVNEEGLIETMGANVPRLDYSGGGCPVLLTEPQRTNLVTYSEDFINASWAKNGASVTSGFLSPDGTLNASKLSEDNTNAIHRIYQTATVSASPNATISIYVKYNQRKFVLLRIADSTVGRWYDIENGVLGSTYTGTPNDSSIESVGNGWYRITISHTVSNQARLELWVSDIESISAYQGDTNKGVYIWGAQVEVGSYPTSLIKTEGSAVTRNGDQVTGAGDAATFNDSEGVLMAEIAALANDLTNRQMTLSDGTNDNRLVLKYDNQSNIIQSFNRVGGVESAFLSANISDITLFSKCLVKYKVNDYQLWINGFKLDADTSASVWSPSTLNDLKINEGGGADFFGNVKQVQYFNTALTDSELETLTSWTSFIEMAQAQNYNII
jgi:hypothetical protein